jgi:hypothetical protein
VGRGINPHTRALHTQMSTDLHATAEALAARVTSHPRATAAGFRSPRESGCG